jgi:hypothetical protein
VTIVRPRIGLTASVMPGKLGTRRTFLNEPYIVAIQEAGGIPLVLTPAHGGAPLRDLFELLDGLVLTGGEDIAPERYGEEVHYSSVECVPERDALELRLLEWALADDLPLLAICRGVQVLNVGLGGTLYQDLPADRPGDLVHDQGWRASSRPMPRAGAFSSASSGIRRSSCGRVTRHLDGSSTASLLPPRSTHAASAVPACSDEALWGLSPGCPGRGSGRHPFAPCREPSSRGRSAEGAHCALPRRGPTRRHSAAFAVSRWSAVSLDWVGSAPAPESPAPQTGCRGLPEGSRGGGWAPFRERRGADVDHADRGSAEREPFVLRPELLIRRRLPAGDACLSPACSTPLETRKLQGTECVRVLRKLVTPLAVCVVLGLLFLPETASAGGRPHLQRGVHKHTGSRGHGGFQAIPEFRPNGAFGSPGGFPLAARPDDHGRSVGMHPGHLAHRSSRHAFSQSFSPAVLYSPAALYGSLLEPSPPTVVVSPVIYASPTVYVSQPSVASQPAPVLAPPPPAESPLPSVVEYPTGRYELRGDGVGTPYVWVWIPNPPSVPPAASPSSSGEPASGPARSAPPSATYRWTDEEGTTFVTNRLEKVPQAYRSRVQGGAEIIR